MYIFAKFTSSNGYQIFDITLCRGDGSKLFAADNLYAVCYHRCGIQQLMFDFFLTEELEFMDMVKLSENDEEPQEEMIVSAKNTLQMIIKQAFDYKGITNAYGFLKMYEAKGRMNNK